MQAVNESTYVFEIHAPPKDQGVYRLPAFGLPEEALCHLRRELEVGFGVVFSVGTSGVFPYIQEPFVRARRLGMPTIEINPGETVLSEYVDYRLPMRAAEAMDEIWKRFDGCSTGCSP